jgi:hypothetical protein
MRLILSGGFGPRRYVAPTLGSSLAREHDPAAPIYVQGFG